MQDSTNLNLLSESNRPQMFAIVIFTLFERSCVSLVREKEKTLLKNEANYQNPLAHAHKHEDALTGYACSECHHLIDSGLHTFVMEMQMAVVSP
jgi:hypothetical protein